MISSDVKYLNEILELSDKKDIIGESPFTKFYVYIKDNKVVSFLVYDDIYDRVEIIYIYTKEGYRNLGIARDLFNTLINRYKDYQNITLEVRKNNINAIKLYESIGFETIGIKPNYYNKDDGLFMKLDLH